MQRGEQEMDDRYRELILQRPILNNQRQRVLSLQDLTLKLVVKIVKQCAHNKQDPRPLDAFPKPLLDLVFTKLTKHDKEWRIDYNKMKHFDIVKQMITQRARQVKFTLLSMYRYKPPWSAWTCEKVQSLFALLDKCKNQLTKLDIELCNDPTDAARPSLLQIQELVSHQMNLTELRLIKCDINDQTLALISSTCPNIRYLYVRDNEEVTDEGLQYLIKDPEGKLSKIINLDVYNTKVTGSGIARFMNELQSQLENVQAEDTKMSEALEQLCQFKKPVQLPKYKYLDNIPKIKSIHFVKIVSMMPNVTSLTLNFCPDYIPLLMLTKVTELELDLKPVGAKNFNLLSENLIPQWSSNLTFVHLYNESDREVEFDFSVFTQCENLDGLYLEGLNLKVEANHELLPSSFSKLSFCIIDTKIPDEFVIKILTNSCLETFDVRLVPDHVVRYVISEARNNPEIFSKLTTLAFGNTPNLPLDTWIQLLCVVPHNTEIDLRDISYTNNILYDEFVDELQSFVDRNNIYVHISYNL